MTNPIARTRSINVEVANIGGIDKTSVTFDPGLTVLSGRNATNRTSFLQALMAVQGSDRISLKADAEEGFVRLTTGDQTYERRLKRENGRVVSSGDPILADSDVADLFAFLLESNEARRAVERNEDLRDLIMRPVDTNVIEAEIADLTAEKERIDDELKELDNLERRATELEAERTGLKDAIEATESELDEKRAALKAADGDVEETRSVRSELESELDDLWAVRSDLEDVEYDLETKREQIASLRDERDELEAELESLPETPGGELATVEGRLDTLHDRKQTITTDLNQLQNIIQFNEGMLDGRKSTILDALSEDSNDGAVTDELLADSQSVVCWTCGERVGETHIEEMLDDLRSLRQDTVSDRNSLEAEIDDLQTKRDELEAQQRRQTDLTRTIDRHEREIEQTEDLIEDLEDRREELEDRVNEIESRVEQLREEEQSEAFDLHKEVNQLELELEQLTDDLDAVESERGSVESRLAERSDLNAQRTEVQSALEERRSRVERIEKSAIEEFNKHMEAVLDHLGYVNIKRIWIERIEREVREGRRKVSKGAFQLHVVRESDSGNVYEDTIDHLSESEREVVGLVFALAGYLVHEVYETVPFMLLDSLEALDAQRIADLIEYINSYAENLIVALLPEDAEALDNHQCITDI